MLFTVVSKSSMSLVRLSRKFNSSLISEASRRSRFWLKKTLVHNLYNLVCYAGTSVAFRSFYKEVCSGFWHTRGSVGCEPIMFAVFPAFMLYVVRKELAIESRRHSPEFRSKPGAVPYTNSHGESVQGCATAKIYRSVGARLSII